jgi:glycyl-tRNA synthetase beta chain
MVENRDLLVEIGTEELPPQALRRLSESFSELFKEQLQQKALGFQGIERFASPRRLAVRVRDLVTCQADQSITRKGPALRAAFKPDGTPTKAAEGFARSCGVPISALGQETDEKGGWLLFRSTMAGAATVELVPEMVRSALAGLPIPKRMRWGSLDSEFVRPVHWIVLLFGREVIEAEILDVRSDRFTRGHRFHHPDPIELSVPDEYEAKLRGVGKVEPSFEVRREMVRELARQTAASLGAQVRLDRGILEEVTALIEWPVPILGSFDPGFLEMPGEVLIETMQKNQKYFPVVDQSGKLLPRFIAISNIESRDPDQVRAGNERVIRPRFKDAAFFWEQDLKQPLEGLWDRLGSVVFQHRLGSLRDKGLRISSVAVHIAEQIDLEPDLADRAARLCKCDLLTDMVGEFASLQGIMGKYYAVAAGEPDCVSDAIAEHYLPRHAGDMLPSSRCGQAVALADKIDTLVGIFSIGQRPSGVKDPFALRRSALGVLRILIETPLALDLMELLSLSAEVLASKVSRPGVVEEVFGYAMDRLRGYYSDQGIGADVVEAVLVRRSTVPYDIDRRVRAVEAFRRLPEAEGLAAANKRIRNILRKAEGQWSGGVSEADLSETAETDLFRRIRVLAEEVRPLFEMGDYEAALSQLASLRDPVYGFFDQVMVMSDDPLQRRNRLALLNELGELFANVADISHLQQAPS